MTSFLKTFGVGLLTIILSPVWIPLFALVSVYLLLVFIFMSLKVLYFDIKNIFVKDKDKIVDPLGDLPEDYEVRRLLEAQEKADVELIVQETRDTTPIETTVVEEEKEVLTIEEQNGDEVPKVELNSSLEIDDGGEE